MSTTNVHNLDAVTLGTAEFYFSPDAASAADARTKGYVDFGNIVSVSVAPEVTKLEHKASRRGLRLTDKTVITDSKLQYTLKVDELDREKWYYALLGVAAPDAAQAAIADAAIDSLDFTAAPSRANVWHDVAVSGRRIRKISELTLTASSTTLTAGTDYELDELTGRIRFLAEQTGTVSGTVSAPAISAADAPKGITPLQQGIRKGYARLFIFDDTHAKKLVYEHSDFSCEISFNAIGDMDGENFGELTLDVLVTSDAGTAYSAE
ncbi:MAG: hypothetical protein LBD30_00330 [Verrucomicrobiales bacterium]|jgi:hypothetical protein|nr:hypothetical protein [Verrucomicrobiales bacterium]